MTRNTGSHIYHVLFQGVDSAFADDAGRRLKMRLHMIRGHHLLCTVKGLKHSQDVG